MDNLTRDETLKILRSMGIHLPLSTKLPDKDLDKRLRDALTSAQYKDQLPDPLNITAFKSWPLVNDGSQRRLLEAIRRGNVQEAMENVTRGTGVPELFVDTFTDLRQTVMGIANFLDNGASTCIIQDKEHEQCAINIRVSRPYPFLCGRHANEMRI